MNNIENSRKYLEAFMKSHFCDYFMTMNEYRPNQGYGDFPNSSEITQCMRNIVGNMEEYFSDISIPEKYATPELLIRAVTEFIYSLESYSPKFDESIKSFSNPDSVPAPIYQINSRRIETIHACNQFVKMAKQELSEVQFKSDDLKKITLIKLLHLAKNLSVGTWITIGGVLISVISYAAIKDESTVNDLNTDIEKYKIQLYLEKEENDSLRKSISTLTYEIGKLK